MEALSAVILWQKKLHWFLQLVDLQMVETTLQKFYRNKPS